MLVFCCVCSESECRRPPDREAGFLSDPEDELTESQKTNKHSVYSTTVPSIDSAMSSWDSSGFDAGYITQGDAKLHFLSKVHTFPHLAWKVLHLGDNSAPFPTKQVDQSHKKYLNLGIKLTHCYIKPTYLKKNCLKWKVFIT